MCFTNRMFIQHNAQPNTIIDLNAQCISDSVWGIFHSSTGYHCKRAAEDIRTLTDERRCSVLRAAAPRSASAQQFGLSVMLCPAQSAFQFIDVCIANDRLFNDSVRSWEHVLLKLSHNTFNSWCVLAPFEHIYSTSDCHFAVFAFLL